MEKRPEHLCQMIENIVSAASAETLKEHLTVLMRSLRTCFEREKAAFLTEDQPVSPETLKGTFEEMFSNWHGKMYLAAESGSRYLAFMSLVSLNEMLSDIGSKNGLEKYDVLSAYDPDDLKKTAEGFDAVLQKYLQQYRKAGMKEQRFPDIDAFISDYTTAINSDNR